MDIAGMIANKTGLSPQLCQKGLGVLLIALKKFAPELHGKVAGFLPESGQAESAYAAAEAGNSGGVGGGGVMGALGGLASKVMGGDAGQAGELMQMFGQAGFSPDQVKTFAPAALEQLKAQVPPDVVNEIYERIPGLKTVA